MIIDAMRKVNADGVAMCDAHPDLEVFRYVQFCIETGLNLFNVMYQITSRKSTQF